MCEVNTTDIRKLMCYRNIFRIQRVIIRLNI